jgi:hypothetical protein
MARDLPEDVYFKINGRDLPNALTEMLEYLSNLRQKIVLHEQRE